MSLKEQHSMSSALLWISDDQLQNDISIHLESPATTNNTSLSHKNSLNLTSSTLKSIVKFNYSMKGQNEFIDKRIEPYIERLQDLEKYYKNLQEKKDMKRTLILKDLNVLLIETSSEILSFYRILLRYESELKTDSALTVVPLDQSGDLYNCLRSIVSIIMIFPYSFFKNLGINTITLCEEIILLKSQHKEVYKQRLLSGLMPVKKICTQESIERYLLLMIVYYIQKKIPEFHTEWVKTFWPSFESKVTNLSTKILEDQYKALCCLVKYCSEDQKVCQDMRKKVQKMRDYLLSIDKDIFKVTKDPNTIA